MLGRRIATTLASSALALTTFGATAVVPDAAADAASPTTTTPIAGPSWTSGVATDNMANFQSWLGHPVALDSTWAGGQSWSAMVNVGWLPTPAQFPGRLAIGMNMLPYDGSGSFSQCAAGAYDNYYAQMGTTLQAMGDGSSFIRLGWEMNGDWFPWSIGNASPTQWIGCWRHEVTALRSTDPGAQIVWNGNSHSSGEFVGRALSYYPGDAYVDVIGVDYYDMWPALSDQQAWDAQYDATEPDGMPAGLGSWLAFAEAHGKQLAVPEWGTVTDQGGGGDDPYYINAMYQFFAANASHIAFEAYFDTGAGHAITGSTQVPNAAAEYQKLWGATTPPAGSNSGGTGGTGTSAGTGNSNGSGTGTTTGSTGSSGTSRPVMPKLPAWTAWRIHRSRHAWVLAMARRRLHRSA